MKHFYTFLVAILFTSLGFGQTTIFSEAGGGAEPAGWTFENNVTSNDIDRGSYWLVEDGTTNDFIITATYDLSSYSSATFTLDVATFGSGTNNAAKIEISDDGGATYAQTEVSNTPSSSSYIDGGTFSLNSLTSQVVIRISSNGSSGKDVRLRNLELVATSGSPITSVEFASASASVLEGVGTTDLTFSITNPDGTNTTSFDVELTTGDNADINGYTTQTVTFPAGSSTDETVTITVTDDTVFEGDETLTFTITSVTGGNMATVGTQSTFDLTIEDNESSPAITIVIEDFDSTYPNWNNDIESQLFVDPTSPNEGLFIQAASSNNANFSGNTAFGRDLGGETGEPTLSPYTFTFDDVDVSNYSSITVSFDYHAFANAETGDYEIVIDGVGQGSVEYFNDPDSSPGVNGTISIPVADGTSTVGLILTGTLNGGSDVIEFDNFKVEGIYNGYAYSDGSWYPADPDGTTGASDAIVVDGVAVLNSDVSLNDVVINPGAGLEVASGATLTVNSLTLESVSTSYSSLILDGDITGLITYNRHVNSFTNDGTANDNDLVSAPLTQLSGEFFPAFAATNTNLFESGTSRFFGPFNNTSGVYENYDIINNATTSLTSATGYRTATTDGGTLSFIGNAEGGNISKNVTVGDDITYGVWNLIGNPYPSYLDTETFLTHVVSTQTSGERNIDLMENASGIYGYDGNASDGWKIITLANASGELIAPGQGFFIAADGNDVLVHDIEFTPAMRTTGSSDDFIAGRNSSSLTFLELNASTANNNYNTEFYFNSNASQGLDSGYDAVIWGGSAPSFALYSHLVQDNTGLPIALQALSDTDYTNVTIPLGVNANQGEQLTFSISETTLPSTVNVYLEDNLSNTFTLLNTSDYILTPNTNLMGTGRFYIHFTNTTLSTTENVFDSLTIYADQTNRSIYIAGEVSENTVAKVYDIQGRLISSKTLTTNLRLQSIDVNNINPGVYIVELSNTSQNKTQKVILK